MELEASEQSLGQSQNLRSKCEYYQDRGKNEAVNVLSEGICIFDITFLT